MIWHDYRRMEMNSPAVVEETMPQRDITRLAGELQSLQRSEGYKQRSVVALIMWEATTILIAVELCGWLQHWSSSQSYVEGECSGPPTQSFLPRQVPEWD